jgi:hypothetical protein
MQVLKRCSPSPLNTGPALIRRNRKGGDKLPSHSNRSAFASVLALHVTIDANASLATRPAGHLNFCGRPSALRSTGNSPYLPRRTDYWPENSAFVMRAATSCPENLPHLSAVLVAESRALTIYQATAT